MTIGERQPLLGNDEQGTVTKQPYSSVSIVPVDESQSVPVTEEDEELRKVREGDEKMSKLVGKVPILLNIMHLKSSIDYTIRLGCILGRNGPDCCCFIIRLNREWAKTATEYKLGSNWLHAYSNKFSVSNGSVKKIRIHLI